jgi:predicted AlkP superfamily pyrophosphatase or phosphodiesterase
LQGENKRIILLSIDGLPFSYFEEEDDFLDQFPTLKYLRKNSEIFQRVKSVNPTLTFPAHTSMITGKDPGDHGITHNAPWDPFQKYRSSWNWFYEDIQYPTIIDYANSLKKTSSTLYWPVTVGAPATWNIPQYWKEKNFEDEKILKALSTKNIYSMIQNDLKIKISELSSDEDRLKVAEWIEKKFHPDLQLVYTTDLDTTHHSKGKYSTEAISKLKKIDQKLGNFIKEIGLLHNPNLILILTSDHGFSESNKSCFINSYLYQKNLINKEKKDYTWIIRSMGGYGLIYGKENSFSQEWIEEIESICPVQIISFQNNSAYEEYFQPGAKYLVLPKVENLWFPSSLESDQIFQETKTSFSHGFPKENSEMDVPLLVFSKTKISNADEIQSIKDVYKLIKKIWNSPEKGKRKKRKS